MKIRLNALATLHGSQYETLSSYQMAHIYIRTARARSRWALIEIHLSTSSSYLKSVFSTTNFTFSSDISVTFTVGLFAYGMIAP